MLGNNNHVQHNATQRCDQPPADIIVQWRNGWPGTGDVFSKWVPIYIDVPYIRDLTVCDLAIVKG